MDVVHWVLKIETGTGSMRSSIIIRDQHRIHDKSNRNQYIMHGRRRVELYSCYVFVD